MWYCKPEVIILAGLGTIDSSYYLITKRRYLCSLALTVLNLCFYLRVTVTILICVYVRPSPHVRLRLRFLLSLFVLNHLYSGTVT